MSKNTMSDKALIAKATSADDIPPPGYVLRELVSMPPPPRLIRRLHHGERRQVQADRRPAHHPSQA